MIAPDSMDTLIDFAAEAAEKRPDIARQGLGAVLAEALVLMSETYHTEGDRAERPTGRPKTVNITADAARQLVKKAGSLRAASSMVGISKSALQRALSQAGL